MNHPRPAIADVLAPGRVAPVRIAPRPAVAPRTFHLLHGARGVAALAVVIFHYNHFYLADHTARDALPAVEAYPYAAILAPIYQHGDFAVELFWVISGFVFAHAYLNRPTSPWRFAVARVARLYPLHLLTLLLVAGLQAASLAFAG
ncbi:MAG: acyltransferase family protein, partial [Pseudomonadota bacterium]